MERGSSGAPKDYVERFYLGGSCRGVHVLLYHMLFLVQSKLKLQLSLSSHLSETGTGILVGMYAPRRCAVTAASTHLRTGRAP
jgi:hypothetical protein